MKVCSIFSQVLKLFSRGGFEKAVKQHKAERHARGFTSWGQFIAMLFCQVGRAVVVPQFEILTICQNDKIIGMMGTWPNVRAIPPSLPSRYSTLPLAKLRIG
jgi:Domain of unknown function (DUF4372)